MAAPLMSDIVGVYGSPLFSKTHGGWRTVLRRFESVRGYPASQSPAVLVKRKTGIGSSQKVERRVGGS